MLQLFLILMKIALYNKYKKKTCADTCGPNPAMPKTDVCLESMKKAAQISANRLYGLTDPSAKIFNMDVEIKEIAAEIERKLLSYSFDYVVCAGTTDFIIYVQTGTTLICHATQSRKTSIYNNINPVCIKEEKCTTYEVISNRNNEKAMQAHEADKIGHGNLKKKYVIDFCKSVEEVKDGVKTIQFKLHKVVLPIDRAKELSNFRIDKFEDGYIGHYRNEMFYYIAIDKLNNGRTNVLSKEDIENNSLEVLRQKHSVDKLIIPDIKTVKQARKYLEYLPNAFQCIPVACWILEKVIFDDFKCGLQSVTARNSIIKDLENIYLKEIAIGSFCDELHMRECVFFVRSLQELRNVIAEALEDLKVDKYDAKKVLLTKIIDLIEENQQKIEIGYPGLFFVIYIELNSAIQELLNAHDNPNISNAVLIILCKCVENSNYHMLRSYVYRKDINEKYEAIVARFGMSKMGVSKESYLSLPFFSNKKDTNHEIKSTLHKLSNIMYKCQIIRKFTRIVEADSLIVEKHFEKIAESMETIRNYQPNKNSADYEINVTKKYYVCLLFTILNDFTKRDDLCQKLQTECDKFFGTTVWDFDDAKCRELFGDVCENESKNYGLDSLVYELNKYMLEKTGPFLTNAFCGWHNLLLSSSRKPTKISKGGCYMPKVANPDDRK